MEFIITFNNIMWGWVLAVILIGTGLYYSIRLGFPQLRQFKHVIGSLGVNLKSDGGGVSGFAALCTAVGAQVGTGSLVGVASALVAGGPGALFWMWVTAVFGMVISFGEATLGQLFHEKGKDGNYYGGAHYYMTKGLHNRPLAIAYAAMTLLTVGVCIAMLQNNSIAAAFTGVFDISPWIPGVLVAFLAALIVLGGVKRITDAASYIVPFMAIGYILVTIVSSFLFSHKQGGGVPHITVARRLLVFFPFHVARRAFLWYYRNTYGHMPPKGAHFARREKDKSNGKTDHRAAVRRRFQRARRELRVGADLCRGPGRRAL